jgi:type II secretory pathway pseudopilin PulG
MLPQAVLIAIAGLAAAISKLIAAGQDAAMQEEALMDGAEALKKALDHFKFGVPEAPVTEPAPE